MHKIFPVLLIVFASLCMTTSSAENTLKLFVSDSLTEIEQAYQGQPFLLSFWSIDCPPCIKEFQLFQRQLQDHPDTRIVLVSTDSVSDSTKALNILKQFSLQHVDSWIFAEEFVERLRYQVDPQWTGSIPQAYFYRRDLQRTRVTGALHAEHFEEWRSAYKKIKHTDNKTPRTQ